MDKLGKYILNEFIPIFFTLFMIISLIISLIFIISISNMTAGLKITFVELLKMYMLSLPQIIFITLSVSFFISANALYAKLSETQELISLFALGIKPIKILFPIIITSILVTLINAVILLISIPYSKMAFNNLKNEKKQEAKFNFESSQISQKFGEWSIFANKGKNGFSNIYLYNSKENRFIIANNANLKSKKGLLHFTLNQGKIYDFNKNYLIIFKKMQINEKIPKVHISIFNFKDYFKYNRKLFVKYIPFALLPVALLFFIPFISFFHPRLQKNRYLAYSIILLTLYIAITFGNKNIIFSFVIPLIFFILGGALYKWKKRF
ncbi:LptF/LptG family permease [Caminibacter sp.]